MVTNVCHLAYETIIEILPANEKPTPVQIGMFSYQTNKLILFVHLDNKTILGYEVIDQSDPAHETEPIRTITLGELSEPHSNSMLIALVYTDYHFPMN
jgi:hypothetical protein